MSLFGGRHETPPEVLPPFGRRLERLEQIAARLRELERAVDDFAADEGMPDLLRGLGRAWSAVIGGIAIPLHHEIGRTKGELMDIALKGERDRRRARQRD